MKEKGTLNSENCIKKYIDENGRISFEDTEFQIMDNIVLCQLSYIDFAEILSEEDEITLKEAFRRFKFLGHCDLKIVWGAGHGFDFLEPCAESNRFGNIVIRNFEDFHDKNLGMQFCGMEFVLNDDYSYIVFRGADETIVGWKECFMLAYADMPSHDYALKYLEKNITQSRKYFIGGHSKGGNLALYGGANLMDKKLNRVKNIFTNDSPGFFPKVDLVDVKKLHKKWISIRPEDSIVGRIFELRAPKDIIVKCNVSGLKQHYLQTWTFENMKPIPADKFSYRSEKMIKALNLWLERQEFDSRMEEIDNLYNALTEGGANTVKDFFWEGKEGYERVLKLYRKTLGIVAGGMISGFGILLVAVIMAFRHDKNR